MNSKSLLLKDTFFKKVTIRIVEKIIPKLKENQGDKEFLYLEISSILSLIMTGILFSLDFFYKIIALFLRVDTPGVSTMIFALIFPLTMFAISHIKRLHLIRLKETKDISKHFFDKYFSKITDFDLVCSLLFAILISGFVHYYS